MLENLRQFYLRTLGTNSIYFFSLQFFNKHLYIIYKFSYQMLKINAKLPINLSFLIVLSASNMHPCKSLFHCVAVGDAALHHFFGHQSANEGQ